MVIASQDEHNPSRHLRQVRFVHITVGEFLRNRHEWINPGPDEPSALALLYGQLEFMNPVPTMVCPPELGDVAVALFSFMLVFMDHLITLRHSFSTQGRFHVLRYNKVWYELEENNHLLRHRWYRLSERQFDCLGDMQIFTRTTSNALLLQSTQI